MPSLSEAADFVRTLALAWKNLAAYPPGHPALTNSLVAARDVLEELAKGSDFELGVTADQLFYADRAIDTVPAQKFAHALYRRGVAIIRFRSSDDTSDVETFLRLLGVGKQSSPDQSLWDALEENGVHSIELDPVDYSGVRVTDDLDDSVTDKDERQTIVQRVLEAIDEDGDSSDEIDLDQLARILAQAVRTEVVTGAGGFDPDATFGVGNVPLPDEISGSKGERVAATMLDLTEEERIGSVDNVLRLLRALPPDVRMTILRAMFDKLATDPSEAARLKSFATELPGDEVIETLQHVAREQTLSSSAMLLLESLTKTSTSGSDQGLSDEEAEALARVFGDEDADRFNPPDHVALLNTTAVDFPVTAMATDTEVAVLEKSLPTVEADEVDRQLENTLVILLRGAGPEGAPGILQRLGVLVRHMLGRSRFDEAVELFERLRAIAAEETALAPAIGEWFGSMARGETLLALVDRLPKADEHNRAGIQKVMDLLGNMAIRSLVEALAEEEDRSRRRRIINLLTSMGQKIAPEVGRRLGDSRWYVVRNMIGLLAAIDDRTHLEKIRELAREQDLRVRLEAIKALLTLEPNPPRELLSAAIHDPDPKVAETAMTLAASYGIEEAVEPLLEIIETGDFFRRRFSRRMKAIQALGELGLPQALPKLRKLLQDTILPWPAPAERHAAWRSLTGYPPESIERLLEYGRKSRDRKVRQIVSGIGGPSQ